MKDQLLYEWKLHWKSLLLAPLALLLACSLFALLQLQMREHIARTYLSFAEVFLPLATGIFSGTLLLREPALELQLTCKRSYRRTSLLRIGLLVLTYGCLSSLVISTSSLLHVWFLPPYILSWPLVFQWLLSQLIWLIPMLWFVAVGMCIALITINSLATGAMLAAFWIIELLFWGPFHDIAWMRGFYQFSTLMWFYQGDQVALPAWYFNTFWLIPHIEQLIMAACLFLLNCFLLTKTEHLLKGINAE